MTSLLRKPGFDYGGYKPFDNGPGYSYGPATNFAGSPAFNANLPVRAPSAAAPAQTITRLYGSRPAWTDSALHPRAFGIFPNGVGNPSTPRFGQTTYSQPAGGAGGAGIMGGFTDAATGEMRAKQLAAEDLLRQQMGRLGADPNWQAARTLAFRAAQNPGYDQALLDRIRGRTAARAAVSGASSARDVATQIARGNITGAAGANLAARGRRGAAVMAQNAGLDVDKAAADAAMTDRARAISNLASLSQTQNATDQNLAMALANTYKGYDPLGMLDRVQRLVSPMGQIGYGQALA